MLAPLDYVVVVVDDDDDDDDDGDVKRKSQITSRSPNTALVCAAASRCNMY
jgi:hypothetical protein